MNKQKGFTIIEVALVLAIAGLIFVMVFIALPGLWATERDSERRDDMLMFVQQLKNFQTNNNRGALPNLTKAEEQTVENGGTVVFAGDENLPVGEISGTGWTDFYRGYFEESFADPDGPRYNFVITSCENPNDNLKMDEECTASVVASLKNTRFPNDYNMYVVLGAVCYGETAIKSANTRRIAALYKMEGGGVNCANT